MARWISRLGDGTGSGKISKPGGIHYELMEVLGKYGRFANGREQALSELKKLLREYEKQHLGTQGENDEDLLSRYEDEP